MPRDIIGRRRGHRHWRDTASWPLSDETWQCVGGGFSHGCSLSNKTLSRLSWKLDVTWEVLVVHA